MSGPVQDGLAGRAIQAGERPLRAVVEQPGINPAALAGAAQRRGRRAEIVGREIQIGRSLQILKAGQQFSAGLAAAEPVKR